MIKCIALIDICYYVQMQCFMARKLFKSKACDDFLFIIGVYVWKFLVGWQPHTLCRYFFRGIGCLVGWVKRAV